MSTVTCRNPACEDNGHPKELELDLVHPDTGEAMRSPVQCGVCRQPITDIVDP